MRTPTGHEEGTGSRRDTIESSRGLAAPDPEQHVEPDLEQHIEPGREQPQEQEEQYLDKVLRKLTTQSKWWCNKKRLMTKTDGNGMCPIHIAAMEGRDDIIKGFVHEMPNCIHIRDKDNKTALHYAVESGQLEAVKVLLSNKNAKIARKMVSHDHDKNGNTALHLAALRAVEPQIVRELLKWPGISVNAVNKEGLSALEIASHSSAISSERDNRSEEIRMILAAIADGGRYSRHSKEKESKIVDVDTVVASLIATVTFATIFQIPGGIENDISNFLYGGAKFALDDAFLGFSIFNTIALFTSLTVVIMWSLRERLNKDLEYEYRSKVASLSAICLAVSIVSTGLAYLCAYIVIVPAKPYELDASNEFRDSRIRVLLLSVGGAALFAPGIAWICFSITVVYRFSKYIFTRKSTVRLFPKPVVSILLATPLPVIGIILYLRFFRIYGIALF